MNEIAEIETLVAREIARVIELIGREFDLPPKTASILSELRAARMKCKKLALTNENHLGWYTFGQENGGISIDNILPLLISELSEIHEEPMGILSALVIGYRDEPALMKGYIKGMYPLFVSAPTGNIVEHSMKRPPELHLKWDSTVTHSTPALVRAAWAGAEEGWWDAEQLMYLPKVYGISDEDAQRLMADAMQEPSVTLA
jgi:hypothetical protein